MARPREHGSIKLNAQQKKAFNYLCGRLKYAHASLAQAMNWADSALSSATSTSSLPGAVRSINPARMRIMEEQLRAAFLEQCPQLDAATISDLEKSFEILFPTPTEESIPSLMRPGAILPVNAPNRIDPHWEATLRDFVVGKSGVADPPRVWVIGGPKTGKTTTLRRVEKIAEEAGVPVLRIDLKPTAQNFQVPSGTRNVEIPILESILEAVGKEPCRIEGDRAGPPILAERFLQSFRNLVQEAAASGRLIVTLDHLYLFGPQDGNPDEKFRQAFDGLLIFILTGIAQSKYVVDQVTMFIADDGAQTSHPRVSSYVTKGKKITLACDQETANAIWAAYGIPIAHLDNSLHFDALGRCIFLHHAAAQLASLYSPLDPQEVERASSRIRSAVALGVPTGDKLLDVELQLFRTRILAWLELKAVHCEVDPVQLFAVLADDSQGLLSLQLSGRSEAELLTALEWGTMFGDPNQPAGFLRDLARAEAGDLRSDSGKAVQ